jgi:hypothetical protein
MKTQALAQIPETRRADGSVARLSNVVKVYQAGDVEVSAIKDITYGHLRGTSINDPSWRAFMINHVARVREHYNASELINRIKSALTPIVPDGQPLTVDELAPTGPVPRPGHARHRRIG